METLAFSSVSSHNFSPSPSSYSSRAAAFRSCMARRRNASVSLSSPWISKICFFGSFQNNVFTRDVWHWVSSKSRGVDRERIFSVRAEMFGQLSSALESAWSKLRGEEVLTKDNIAEPMRDIRRALLEADVSLPVVRRFVQSVSDQAIGIGLIRGVRPDQQLVKIVHDELVKLMGGELSDLVFSKTGTTVILLAGLQGVGKTTVCAKLAFYLKKLGKSSMMVAADIYRPAAIDQLVILGDQIGVPVYKEGTEVSPSQIARNGLEAAKKKKIDVVIVDTAGRLQAQ